MKKTTLSTQSELLPHLCSPHSIIGLILAGELLALILVLSRSELRLFSWADMGIVSMVIQWIILASAMVLCSLRHVFRQMPPTLSGSLAYAIVLVIAAIVLAIGHWLLSVEPPFWSFLTHLIIAAVLSGIMLRYLYLQQQLHNQKQAELQSRIHALQARIKPHFLFNSMNTIASLIAVNQDAAEKAVEDLSELFRASLQCANLVPLADELSLCHRYVAIEKLRLGDRLRVEWQCNQLPEAAKVPGLSVQPLIENAICHGIQKLQAGGLVEVIINTSGEYLLIQIRNPFPIDSACTKGKEGHEMAMRNINHRLQAHYGGKASLKVNIEPDNDLYRYYRVTMRLPL